MSEWRIGPKEDLQAVADCAAPGTVLRLAPAVYRQRLTVRTPGLVLIGDESGRTRIVANAYARQTDELGRPLTTFRTATVHVTAPNVTLCSLTVENDAGDPAAKGQQVALAVYGNSFTADRIALLSTQDTLFLGPLPSDLRIRYRDLLPEPLRRPASRTSFFSDCRIEGSVDFIFGGGNATFEDCEIRSIADGRTVGYVAAPSHDRSETHGFRFAGCRFTHDKDVAPGSVFLARPWRNDGLAAFIDCAYGDHIAPAGFDRWGTTERDKTARFYETPAVSGRVPWVKSAP